MAVWPGSSSTSAATRAGVLDAALAIADMFIKDGVIASVKGRGNNEEVYRAKAEGTLPDLPIAILVNGQSASASEIVSGALSDHDRAVVIGTRTFGKGLVQAVQSLRKAEGGQIKYTAQRYYLPIGPSHPEDRSVGHLGRGPHAGLLYPDDRG